MGQIVSGARTVLEIPLVYDFLQDLVGGSRQRSIWVRDFLKPLPGARVLDIGCGTGNLLRHLPADVDYTGFDLSPAYIDTAQRRYGRGRFICADVATFESIEGSYDLAIAYGVLHHVGDTEAEKVFQGARRALKPGGRLVTLDPTLIPNQRPVSRYLASRDRGHHVRAPQAYAELGRASFSRIDLCTMPKVLRIHIDAAVLVCPAT